MENDLLPSEKMEVDLLSMEDGSLKGSRWEFQCT